LFRGGQLHPLPPPPPPLYPRLSYIPSGLSGREPARKKFILSHLLLSSRPRVYRSLGKSLERPFSLLDSNPINSLHFPDPRFLFPWTTQFPLLRVENSRPHLSVLDFSFCRQSLRSVFLRQDWLGFFGVVDMLRKAIKVGLYCVFVLVSKVSMYNKK
jgi:hypothetical protein